MKNTIIAIIALLVLLTVSFYGYEFVFKKPLVESPTANELDDLLMPSLDVKEQYKGDGTYAIAGEIEVPTPCYAVRAELEPIGQVDNVYNSFYLNIAAIPPKDGVVCAQVVTKKSFKLTGNLPVNSKILDIEKTFVDSIGGVMEYKLNRFEIPTDANIDTYQLQMKG